MAKLEIKLNEEARQKKQEAKTNSVAHGMRSKDYDILVDGHEIRHLTSLDLSMASDEFNAAIISFYVDDVDIEEEVLVDLQAILDKKKEEE